MKKKFLILAIALISVMLLASPHVLAKKPIRIMVGGELLQTDVNPVIIEGRTLVPLRAIFEALNATVEWDGAEQKVTATKDGVVISLKIGSTDLNVNSQIKTLDVPAQIIDGRTMIPVRAVSEALDADVSWNKDTETVVIKTDVWLPSKVEICDSWFGSNTEYSWYEYTYNPDGSEREDYYINDTTDSKENAAHSYVITEYNSDGDVIKQSLYIGDDSEPQVTEFVYTDRGLLISDEEFTYEYDADDNLIKKEKDGESNVYTYNANGQLIRDYYTSDSAYYRMYDQEYIYDDNNNITKVLQKYSYYFGSDLKTQESSIKYKYDDYGRVTEAKEIRGTEEYVAKYAYDADGNLQYENDGFTEAEYKYFPNAVLRYSKFAGDAEYTLVRVVDGPLASGVEYSVDKVNYSLDDKGRITYISMADDEWYKIVYDENGNIVYKEDSTGSYEKTEYIKVKI